MIPMSAERSRTLLSALRKRCKVPARRLAISSCTRRMISRGGFGRVWTVDQRQLLQLYDCEGGRLGQPRFGIGTRGRSTGCNRSLDIGPRSKRFRPQRSAFSIPSPRSESNSASAIPSAPEADWACSCRRQSPNAHSESCSRHVASRVSAMTMERNPPAACRQAARTLLEPQPAMPCD